MIYLTLFLTFLKIGAFTFGGGYAMLSIIQQEVLRNGWMTREEVVNFIAVSESTPGPFAINVSTFVGMRTAGLPGAIVSTVGVALPSVIVILLVAGVYEKFRKSSLVKGAMRGLHPAVVGLVTSAVVSIGRGVFVTTLPVTSPAFLFSAGVFVIMTYLAIFKKVSAIPIILLSGLLGLAAGYGGLL